MGKIMIGLPHHEHILHIFGAPRTRMNNSEDMEPLSEFLTGFFTYSYHMNQAVEAVFLKESQIPEKAILLYSHSLNAQHIWNCRIMGVDAARGVWEPVATAEMAELNKSNHASTLEILEQGNLGEMVHYTNTKGETFVNSRQDILLHVVNHTTYHRGQIASSLKQAGLEPPVTDYIFYKRTHL